MRRTPWATYLWPGLPQLWTRGSWSALAVAAAAAALLNLALLGTFAWSELIVPDLRSALWVALGTAWTAAAVFSAVHERRHGGLVGGDTGAFAEAQEHYLKGNWFEAERILASLLREDARDLEARLMLATLLRHTRRYDEAGGELDVLVRFEGAGKWELEIGRERELLAEARQRRDTQDEDQAGPDLTDPPAEVTHAA